MERTVEVSGPDADKLIDSITCRDLTKCQVGQGKYMLVTAPDGSIVNDPVLLHIEKDKWWMQLADSDAGLYALGALANSGLDAEVTLPDVHPVQVQGPKAVKTLQKLVGDEILTSSTTGAGTTTSRGSGSRSAAPAGRRSRASRSTCWTTARATRCGTRS